MQCEVRTMTPSRSIFPQTHLANHGVMFKDSATALRLLDVLQNTPQRQFLGRYLRFEQARAFRTLLISYR